MTDHQSPGDKNELFSRARPNGAILGIAVGRAGRGSGGGRRTPTETVGPETGTENVPR